MGATVANLKQVIRVAKEVGTEGKLGGQACVKGVAGAWKNLTDNVNTMAANLTGQVRAIAQVAQAVTQVCKGSHKIHSLSQHYHYYPHN